MSDEQDIVERLRADRVCVGSRLGLVVTDEMNPLSQEAASLIERLRGQVETLAAALRQFGKDLPEEVSFEGTWEDGAEAGHLLAWCIASAALERAGLGDAHSLAKEARHD